jgi:hypothetical protein
VSHPDYLRKKAVSLRIEKGLTIDEIAERLALSRSTVYHWVRAHPIARRPPPNPPPYYLGNQAMQAKWRRLREAAYDEGRASFATLAAEPTFRDFVSLYIAEGYKRTRHKVSISNSDPAVMAVSVRWLRRLSDRPIAFHVQYHADQDLDELRVFWGAQFGIDGSTIKLLRKSNSNQLKGRTWRSAHGVIAATVNDTLLRARLQGWVDAIEEEWLRLAS